MNIKEIWLCRSDLHGLHIVTMWVASVVVMIVCEQAVAKCRLICQNIVYGVVNRILLQAVKTAVERVCC